MKFFRSKEVQKKREDYAYVLDVFEAEKSIFHRKFKGRIAQLIGEKHFTLLEGLVRENTMLGELERVYIGPGPRDKISAILRRITLEELTSIAKAGIENAVTKAIIDNEERWVKFFNEAGPLTRKLHSLELLPGIGKKKMWKIVQEREKCKFTSFEDIAKRTGIDPVKAIVRRVLDELRGREKYELFVDMKHEFSRSEYY